MLVLLLIYWYTNPQPWDTFLHFSLYKMPSSNFGMHFQSQLYCGPPVNRILCSINLNNTIACLPYTETTTAKKNSKYWTQKSSIKEHELRREDMSQWPLVHLSSFSFFPHYNGFKAYQPTHPRSFTELYTSHLYILWNTCQCLFLYTVGHNFGS